MSFQPPAPPQGPIIPAPAPAVAGASFGGGAVADTKGHGRAMRTLGVLVAVLGLVAGAVLFVFSGKEPERAVKGFARAPGGCRTTLDFDGSGTFTLFVETKGKVGDLSGDCEGADQTYDRNGEPDVDLTLIDEDDEEVDLDRVSEPSYDTGGFVGTAVRTFEVDSAGTYRLRVDSPDSDFAIAVGRDVNGSQGMLRLGALLAGIGGPLLGLLLWLLGRRKRAPAVLAAPGAPAIPPTGTVYEPPYVGGPPNLVHPPPPPPPPLSSSWPVTQPIAPQPNAPEQTVTLPAQELPTEPLPQQPSPWADQQWQRPDPPPPA